MTSTTELDRAILAHRADPTPTNRARVMDAQRAQNDRFHAEMAVEYVDRVRG